MAKINIYIKGVCDYLQNRRGGYAYVMTTVNGLDEMLCYNSSRKSEYVMNHFVTEIVGLTDALQHINDKEEAEVRIITNNKVMLSLIGEEHYGYAYDEYIRKYWDVARDMNVTLEWRKKSDNCEWMRMADKKANKFFNE